MLRIPSLQLSIRNFDELMGDGTIFFVHHALLADSIAFPLRNEIDPEVVVNSADGNTRRLSQYEGNLLHICKTLTSQFQSRST